MPFEKITSEKISAAVVRQIERLILRGILRPGERLPAERDLADRLGVSRPSLREAISTLQDQGLLDCRRGSGIYVADVLGSAFSEGLVRLFGSDEEAVFDTLAFRRDVEGLAAERAARLGSDGDLQLIDHVFARMEAASERADSAEEARLDAEFHQAIIEASHNVILLHMMRSMYELLREGVFYNRQIIFGQQRTSQSLLEQHRAIRDAILARKPEAARKALEDHLDFVERSLREQARSDRNAELADKRLEQEQARK